MRPLICDDDHDAMPIGLRAPDLPPVAGLDGIAATKGPPDVLRHSGGPNSLYIELGRGPEEGLALDAVEVSRLIGDPTGRSRSWAEPRFSRLVGPRFAREVELVRAHLGPIRTRAALAASFGREAFHVRASDRVTGRMSAVRVAYALRWLEIEDGIERPPSGEWMAHEAVEG